MNKLLRILPALVLLLAASGVEAAPRVHMRLPDAPARFLYDEPGVLAGAERAAIEDSLMAMDRRGLEIGVAIFQSIHGESVEDLSLALAEKWRPGGAERDNGALIVIALEERKVRIEVGYGLEERVTDAAAGRIIRYDMAPAFRDGRYGDGIMEAAVSLAKLAGGQPLPESSGSIPAAVPLIIVLVLVFFVVMVARAGRHATMSGRGIRGGTYRGPSGPFWGGGFGGGGGGGGFGGGSFGGGSFGGGGASGSW